MTKKPSCEAAVTPDITTAGKLAAKAQGSDKKSRTKPV